MKNAIYLIIIFIASITVSLKAQLFTAQHIITEQNAAYACVVADLDSDGFNDFIGYSMEEDKLVWYRNDGTDHFYARYLPMEDIGGFCLHVYDMDGDLDMDIMVQPSWSSELFWYENDGSENFTQHTCVSGISYITSSQIIDVDDDGDLDVVASSQANDEVLWLENNGSNTFTYHSVYLLADYIRDVYAEDIDGDLDIDFVSASTADDKIAWYENDGSENFTVHIISTSINGAMSVQVSDIDGDTDMDILYSSIITDELGWMENDGNENFTINIVSDTINNPKDAFVYDVDGDLDMDFISTSGGDNKIYWFENDGNENFTSRYIQTDGNGPEMIFPFDVDDDNNIDFISTTIYDFKIQWHHNDGMSNFNEEIITTWAVEARTVKTADLDGDNDLDVISVSPADNRVTWYENIGDNCFKPHAISDTTMGAYDVLSVDMDNDNDSDIVVAANDDGTLEWYENTGFNSFTGHDVYVGQNNIISIFAIDLDMDNDMDIVSGSDPGMAYWYENDGNMSFTQHAVTSAWYGHRDVEAADMDNDGDIDVVAIYMPQYSYNNCYIRVYENNGSQIFSSMTNVDDTSQEFNQITITDYDGDAIKDIIATITSTALVWYERTSSTTYPYSRHTISSGTMDIPWTIDLADIDNDGDVDFVVPSSDANAVHWVENQNNTSYVVHDVSTKVMYSFSAVAADIDQDGDFDIVTASSDDNKVSWHENNLINCDLNITLSINGSTDFCGGDSTELEVYTENTTAGYQWFLNGDTIPGATDSILTVYTSGIYYAVVTDTACSKTTANTIINTIEDIVQQYPSICSGDSILVGTNYYSQSGNYSDTLINYLGCDSIIITELTVNSIYGHTDTAFICYGDSVLWQGTYYYTTDIVYDSLMSIQGCDSILILDLTVNMNPSVNILGNTEDCVEVLLDEGLGIPGDQYLWSTNDTTQSILVNTSGSYSLSVIDGNGCVGYDTVDVTIYGLPSVNIGQDTIICDVDNILLDAGQGFDTYLWSDGSTLQTITIDSSGIGLGQTEITVIITDTNLCQNTDTIVISFVACTKNPESNIQTITIYPNPVYNYMIVETPANFNGTIKIFSMSGQIVFEKNIVSEKEALNISKISPGSYMLEITDDKSIFRRQIQIIK